MRKCTQTRVGTRVRIERRGVVAPCTFHHACICNVCVCVCNMRVFMHYYSIHTYIMYMMRVCVCEWACALLITTNRYSSPPHTHVRMQTHKYFPLHVGATNLRASLLCTACTHIHTYIHMHAMHAMHAPYMLYNMHSRLCAVFVCPPMYTCAHINMSHMQ